MKNDPFKTLIGRMGGRDAFIKHVTDALDAAGDEVTTRPAYRTFYSWTQRGLPEDLKIHIIVLAAANNAGVDPDAAVKILPELKPALNLMRQVAA